MMGQKKGRRGRIEELEESRYSTKSNMCKHKNTIYKCKNYTEKIQKLQTKTACYRYHGYITHQGGGPNIPVISYSVILKNALSDNQIWLTEV